MSSEPIEATDPAKGPAEAHQGIIAEPLVLSESPTEGVLHLRLNRPAKGNALSAAMVQQLQEAVDQAAGRGVRLLVLEGAGRHFCTGFDLSNLEEEDDDSLLARFARVELLLQSLHAAPFATLALAQGRAMGAGADIFCACSHRWIVGEASFAFPGTAFGLVLGTARLADAVGAAQAGSWVQSGQTFGAAEALAAGMAQRQLAHDALPAALAGLQQDTLRLDAQTHAAVHQALDAARRPRGDAGDALDLARLLRSAARAGLKERILRYREAAVRPR